MNARVPSAAAAALSLVFALGLVSALVLAAGCNGRPGTPEELYAKIAVLNGAGETGQIWDLLTEEAREREITALDKTRTWLRKNPDPNQKITRQYKCTREEFMVLSNAELYRRENVGNERAFVDAKIVDRTVDPRNPSDVILTVQSPLGTKFIVQTHPVDGGWGLVRIVPVAQ